MIETDSNNLNVDLKNYSGYFYKQLKPVVNFQFLIVRILFINLDFTFAINYLEL
jgi:hypothetical protein